MSLNLYQKLSERYKTQEIEAEARSHREYDKDFAAWAAGCGVIKHTAATQLQVFELATTLLEAGLIEHKAECYRKLTALD